jgi:hypothetical protein
MPLELSLLLLKRDELHEQLTKSNERYIHPRTIDNLLFHIDDIDKTDEKDWVLCQLNVYFETCQRNLPAIDRTFSLQLYYEILYPLLDYYHRNLQFVKFDLSLFVPFYVIGFSVAFFIFGIKGLIAVSIILIFRAAYFYRKYKEKKVFSLFY